LSHLFNLVKEISAVAVIFLMLIYFEPYSTLVVLFFFFIVSVLYIYFLKPAINKKSNQNQNLRNDFINIVYETFGAGLKDIKLANKEEEINDYFKKKIKIYEENLFIFFFLERLPRLILEVLLIFILFALCIFYLAYSNNNIYNLPSLSLFIIGAIRFLPAFSGITLSRYYLKLFDPSLKGLKNELDIVKNFENSNSYVEDLNPNINFSNTFRIELKNIYFKYPNDKIGISGPSGCGKSTLFDILLGLIKPMRGQVLVNNYEIFKNLKNWRTSIGYVSQNLFILDSTFRENIAFNFGSEKIDNEKVYKAIEISGLTKLINNSENGLETSVGVNGLKLSGGERQRLALARAIYKDPEIFFLDEFTSALDLETEKKIFKKIFKIYNNKTFIIIAHSESVLNHCNKIYFLRDGKLNIKL
jgi:ATP-binding cassette subfamily B protein